MQRIMMKFFTVMFMLSPVILLVLGIYFVYDMATFSKHSIKTVGVIVESERKERYDSDDRKTHVFYTPVIEFVTEDNRTIITPAKEGDSNPKWRVDEEVNIRYDKENPRNIRLTDSKTELILACFTLTLGSILAVILLSKGKKPIKWRDDY